MTLFETKAKSQRVTALRFGMVVALKRYIIELRRNSDGTAAPGEPRRIFFLLPFLAKLDN